MKIKLPKTPIYSIGDIVQVDRLIYECNRTAPIRLTEFICMGNAPSQNIENGLALFGHTEVWRGERVGGDWDGGFWQDHVFVPHAKSETV